MTSLCICLHTHIHTHKHNTHTHSHTHTTLTHIHTHTQHSHTFTHTHNTHTAERGDYSDTIDYQSLFQYSTKTQQQRITFCTFILFSVSAKCIFPDVTTTTWKHLATSL